MGGGGSRVDFLTIDVTSANRKFSGNWPCSNDLLKRQVRNEALCWANSLTSQTGMGSRPHALAGESLIRGSTFEIYLWIEVLGELVLCMMTMKGRELRISRSSSLGSNIVVSNKINRWAASDRSSTDISSQTSSEEQRMLPNFIVLC